MKYTITLVATIKLEVQSEWYQTNSPKEMLEVEKANVKEALNTEIGAVAQAIEVVGTISS